MACEFCKESELVSGMNYCPYCGKNLKMARFLSYMLQANKEAYRLVFLQNYIDTECNNETVEIDGEILDMERIECPTEETEFTPLDYSFDSDKLNKIDISKERALLEKYYRDHPNK
jgi:transcriptional regulator of aromatic amino acid metabolism